MRTQLVLAALLAVALAPTASAAPPEPQCIQVYRELTPPPVAVTLVNGCTVQVEVTIDGDACLMRYLYGEVGPLFFESRSSCHYLVRASADPTVGASGPETPPCYDIYNRWDVGPVTVIQRSSCEYEVHVDGQQVFPPTVAAEPQCMPVYQEYEVGPVKVVRRNSCSAEVYLFGRPVVE